MDVEPHDSTSREIWEGNGDPSWGKRAVDRFRRLKTVAISATDFADLSRLELKSRREGRSTVYDYELFHEVCFTLEPFAGCKIILRWTDRR